MKEIFQQIQGLLGSGLGNKLQIDASRIRYVSEDDPGLPVDGFNTSGSRETITIPDEYMSQANANSAAEFLSWLQSQQ